MLVRATRYANNSLGTEEGHLKQYSVLYKYDITGVAAQLKVLSHGGRRPGNDLGRVEKWWSLTVAFNSFF